MVKTLTAIKDELHQNFLNLMGLITVLGQLAFLTKLFSSETPTHTIYLTSLGLFCAMMFLFVQNYLKIRNVARCSRKYRIYGALSLVYAFCALLALLPAGYRWWYIHYPHEPDVEPEEPIIGKLWFGISSEVHAAERQPTLELHMSLDSLRTSFQCSRTRNRKATDETFNVADCAEYAIPSYRLEQIANGHGLDESASEKEEFDRLYSAMMKGAFRALETIATYRGKHEPFLDRGPVIMQLFSQKPAWKKTLLDAKLLPNAGEWERLTREYPERALDLRKFIIEWVGFVDPFFRLTFRNTTSRPIQISTIRYTADPRREVVEQATLIGVTDVPRYLLELRQGQHYTDLQPTIVVPAQGTKEIELQLRLKQPVFGLTYDIKLEFLSERAESLITLPSFGVTFVRNR
jgi:hypothetical protein